MADFLGIDWDGNDWDTDETAVAADYQPWIWLVSPDKPVFHVGSGYVWGERLFVIPPDVVVAGDVNELATSISGTATATADLNQIIELTATIGGGSAVASQFAGEDIAGFEIPYLIGLGGTGPLDSLNELDISTISGSSTVTADLTHVHELSAVIAGTSTMGEPCPVPAFEKVNVTTNTNGSATLPNAVDGVEDTLQFISLNSQAPGHYVQVQFSRPRKFGSVSMVANAGAEMFQDYPRAWEVLVSNDGATFTRLATGSATGPDVFTHNFPPSVGAYTYWRWQLTVAQGNFWRVNEFQFCPSVPIVFSPENIAAEFGGTSTVTAEIFATAVANLSCTINGSSTVFANSFVTLFEFDPRSQTYLYIYSNIGVGFDPTDTYAGATTQIFPDGHTRDDFHEYLYIYSNITAGFDPSDDVSDHPDFVTQIFPDGHTVFDFHEYLYLYLNVVRGRQQHGQLVIRPGFTKGAILPSAKPPRIEPQ